MSKYYNPQRIIDLYGSNTTQPTVFRNLQAGNLPPLKQISNQRQRKYWEVCDLPIIGEKYGFLKHFSKPTVITLFTTKGGVLKTTLAFNIARMAALHNIKTCVIGLDLQGDITRILEAVDTEEANTLEEAKLKISQIKGLYEFEQKQCSLQDILYPTEIPTLSYIPESPLLMSLERILSSKTRQENWLKEHVIEPLKEQFELIVIDCSPNWNRLVTNAFFSTDVMISPLECKFNHFANSQEFISYIDEFKKENHLSFLNIFVPTRLVPTQKLNTEIRFWYMANISTCTNNAIRESVVGEDARAEKISIPEQAPKTIIGTEFRELLSEIWEKIG